MTLRSAQGTSVPRVFKEGAPGNVTSDVEYTQGHFALLGLEPTIAKSLGEWENAELGLTQDGFILEVFEDARKNRPRAMVEFDVRNKHLRVKTLDPEIPYKLSSWHELVNLEDFDMAIGVGKARYDHDLVFKVEVEEPRVRFSGDRVPKLTVWIDKTGEAGIKGSKGLLVGGPTVI